MRRAPVMLLSLTFLAAACGVGKSATPTRTAPPATRVKTYADPKYRFSFAYPATWSLQPGSAETDPDTGVKSYLVKLTAPQQTATTEISIDGNTTPFPSFTDGHVAPDPGTPGTFWYYYHDTVSGLPAMRIEQKTHGQLSEIDTFVLTRNLRYDIRILAANPPMSQRLDQQYAGVVKSMKLPFGQ